VLLTTESISKPHYPYVSQCHDLSSTAVAAIVYQQKYETSRNPLRFDFKRRQEDLPRHINKEVDCPIFLVEKQMKTVTKLVEILSTLFLNGSKKDLPHLVNEEDCPILSVEKQVKTVANPLASRHENDRREGTPHHLVTNMTCTHTTETRFVVEVAHRYHRHHFSTSQRLQLKSKNDYMRL
jgi:hypothetical protein